jgi:hypothetical protein
MEELDMALSMMQTMSIWSSGRCKCPHCGKFRKETDFEDQPKVANIAGNGFVAHVHLEPACKFCIEKWQQQNNA